MTRLPRHWHMVAIHLMEVRHMIMSIAELVPIKAVRGTTPKTSLW